MKIVFTSHAEFRLRKRGILKEEIIGAIENPDSTQKKGGKHYFQKAFGRGKIEVVAENTQKHLKVITVYWF
ncbi:MAG: DUF4258 domain-containing protein [Candidatus Diapherotrites archaeon]